VVKPMTMPRASPVTAPTAIASPMLIRASLGRAVVASGSDSVVCGALGGSRLNGTEPVTSGAS
jgi:acyl dehydratase